MLKKGESLIVKNNWDNISLFQADARDLSPSTIEKYTRQSLRFDRIICVLGLSVIPDWEKVLNNLISLLKENGKIVVVDVYAEKRNFNIEIKTTGEIEA
ncbi:MAG TPA: class I SAM-dependent methyltransferase, partial [Bacteroidia bacterium]|nr:class I SAM-dependent methyltransferase [Bacteroidia bacterium]